MVYRLDYKLTLDKDYQEYRQIFTDAGWELVCVMSNWHYYRILPENDKVPEIYNDNRSKAAKYQRLLVLFLILLPTIIFIRTTVTNVKSCRLPRTLEFHSIFNWVNNKNSFSVWCNPDLAPGDFPSEIPSGIDKSSSGAPPELLYLLHSPHLGDQAPSPCQLWQRSRAPG